MISADRLHAAWTFAQRARELGQTGGVAPVERLFEAAPRHCGPVTVLDSHPATMSRLVAGNRTRALGVERSGQTGSIAELYRHCGIDAEGIIAAASAIAPERPIRHLRAAR